MSKKNKNPITKPPARIAPRQQNVPIENMSGEELALLLGEQYKLVMQCQNNILAINGVLEQRRLDSPGRALAKAKEATDGKQRD